MNPLACGPLNSIADVSGVTVGHATLAVGDVQTGVTVIRPHEGDCFERKVPAAVDVINGFGKSVGLVQLRELGCLETPIALTNTFAVGTIATAQIQSTLLTQPEVGRTQPTVNPLVLECNDGFLNDLQAFAVHPEHYEFALHACKPTFAQGSVGAGRGMSCFGLKGGIGSASCRVPTKAGDYMLGVLVLANFGRPDALTLQGLRCGEAVAAAARSADPAWPVTERGSIIMIVATDAPLDSRQLRRVARRTAAGLARTGSDYGHGSGDIALAFSTAYALPAQGHTVPIPPLVHETLLDPLFQATAQATEQAIVNALLAATTVQGFGGHYRVALSEVLDAHPQLRTLAP